MKNVGFIFILLLINCQEPKETLSENKFSKNVGLKIPIDVAERWVARYRTSNRSSRSQDVISISAATLRDFTNSQGDYNGIIFHHAFDDNGNYHTLLIPYTEGLSLWNASQVIDSNIDSSIDPTIAKSWTQNYVDENPNGVWSHFFGSLIFTEILSRPMFERMDLAHALSDTNEPQFLLYVTFAAVTQNGRSQGESVEVYDQSNPCPPFCNP
jgi:hypothetical protein